MSFLSAYFGYLFIGLFLNWLGTLLTAAVFVVFLRSGVRPAKSAAYSCFFLCGAAVAKLQWVLSIEEEPIVLVWNMYGTIAVVGTFGLVGLLTASKSLKEDNLLIAIIALTVGLAVLQFGGVPDPLLNWYARLYALVCLAAPLVALVPIWSNPIEPNDSK